MSLPEEFYISLVSDECVKNFNFNTKTSFINSFPKPLLFPQDYCVALTEIYIPPFSVLVNNNVNLGTRRHEYMLGAPWQNQTKSSSSLQIVEGEGVSQTTPKVDERTHK